MSRKNIVQEIIDKAFRRAKQNAESIKAKNKMSLARKRELVRIETVRNIVISEIDKLLLETPDIKSIHAFYKELLDIIFGSRNIKRAKIRLRYIKSFIDNLYETYKNSIKISRDINKLAKLRKEFYGRIASFLKRNSEFFELLYNVKLSFRKFPKFKAYPTVVIAGLPNVGKSTLLYKLTGSKPEIQPYPFTTKDIKIGYIETPYFKIQIIDTPGMLDRPLSEMNPIEKKAVLAIKHLAHLIIYVIDITESCGYTIKEQLDLLNQIKREFNLDIWIYYSKADLFSDIHWKKLKELSNLLPYKHFYNPKELRKELIEFIKNRKDLYL